MESCWDKWLSQHVVFVCNFKRKANEIIDKKKLA